MQTVAVVLSGCGVYDGSEIYETVMTLFYLEQAGVRYQCMAPDVEQLHVINHATGEIAEGESRNVLVESARLARGEIIDLANARAQDYDALIVPGGFGDAKNLCNFATAGDQCEVNADLAALCQAMRAADKPVGLICIAPAMAPRLFGEGVRCTIGEDADVSAAIESMGGQHQQCPVDEIVVDEAHKLVTTPAYMSAGSISEAASGIHLLVAEVLRLA